MFLNNLGAWTRGSWEWFRLKAQDPKAVRWFTLYAFFDPTILPVPFDPFLALLVLERPSRWPLFLFLSSCAATLGAVFGYLVAALFYATIIEPIVWWFGVGASISAVAVSADQFTFIGMFVTAITPISDPPIIIAAGLLQVNLFMFALAFFIGRTLRSLTVIVVTRMFGERVIRMLEERAHDQVWGILTITALLIIVASIFFTVFFSL